MVKIAFTWHLFIFHIKSNWRSGIMSCFFMRFFKKICVLILFMVFSLFLVNASTFTFAMNNNFMIVLSRLSSDKEFLPLLECACVVVILLCVSVKVLKACCSKAFDSFNKQMNDRDCNNGLFIKGVKCNIKKKGCLQLRI